MTEHGRISRLVEHWTLPTAEQVVDHVRRAKIQVVQCGNYGFDFYSIAEADDVAASWVGMPLRGIRENLDMAAEVIPQIQEAGARVVGQLSTTMHFGHHEDGLGLFGESWQRMWTDDILGPAPCSSVDEVCQWEADGQLRWRVIDGRPYRTYRGCMCNPRWEDMLRAMVRKGVELGLDGFNATHHYESFCYCAHCADYIRAYLRERLGEEDIERIFGTGDLEQVEDLQSCAPGSAAETEALLELTLAKAAVLRRKESFDIVFTDYGRSLRPGLLLAQWNHKYDFRPHDERSLLPKELWGRGEDYIWYSQGPYKWGSSLAQGYLADMGLPSRFIYAAWGGRPFVINKYDYKRWRIWAAEAMAHHGTALAFHAGPPRIEQEEPTNFAPEDYYAPVIRYQRFMARHEELLHPATPYSQIALVYPRRAELEAEMDCLNALKRLGQLLEDGHWLFDIILDEQLLERAGDYAVLVLPETERLSREEAERLRQFARDGGRLVFTGGTGRRDLDGSTLPGSLLKDWCVPPVGAALCGVAADGQVLHVPDGPWQPEKVSIDGLDAEMPIFPRLEDDDFGQQFLREFADFVGERLLVTDAPWFVRVRAWRPDTGNALVLHWINYLQAEEAAIEIPIPVGPLQVQCRLPDNTRVERVEWHYPEMKTTATVELEEECESTDESVITFTIPRLIVYGMAVVQLQSR